MAGSADVKCILVEGRGNGCWLRQLETMGHLKLAAGFHYGEIPLIGKEIKMSISGNR
tara:strand:+ start:318 stop:488 length:171 start_codon:yes stop_codon:yes gene_type:complete